MTMQNVFTGKTGTISLVLDGSSSADLEHATAAQIPAAYGDTKDKTGGTIIVGRATGIQVAVQTNLNEFHEIGHRHPIVLQPGDIRISGTINHAYLSGALLFQLLGQRARQTNQPDTYPQPAFSIHLDLNDPAVPKPKASLVINGVKFQNWGVSVPEDDFVMENVAFRALTIAVNDTNDGTASTPTFIDPFA